MASSSNSSMMSTIDSLKEKMSDEVYLALCEKMKELHTEQQVESSIPVRIWFMTVRTCYVDSDHPTCDGLFGELYEVVPVQKIVMMSRSEMDMMRLTIDSNSRHVTRYSFNDPVNVNLYEAPDVSHLDCLHPYEVEVFRVEEVVEV